MFSSSVIAAPPYLSTEHNESLREPCHLPPSWSEAKLPKVVPPAPVFQVLPLSPFLHPVLPIPLWDEGCKREMWGGEAGQKGFA